MRNYKLKGFFSWEVVDEKSGTVVDSAPVHNNLILTQGINAIAVRSFAENIFYCTIGTGTTAPTIGDIGLENETQRTGNINPDAALPCNTTLVDNVYSITKTFKFPNAQSTMTIGEIGWSWSSSAGNNLFSRALIVKDGAIRTINLQIGLFLRVSYTLQITIGPSIITYGDANIIGWTAPGSYMMQLIGLRSFTTAGALSYYDAANDCNEPSASAGIFIGTNATQPAAFGSTVNRSASTNYTTTSSNTYAGSGVLIKRGTFGKGVAVSSSLNSMGVGSTSSPQTNNGFVFVFDFGQSKLTDYILPLQFVYTWSS